MVCGAKIHTRKAPGALMSLLNLSPRGFFGHLCGTSTTFSVQKRVFPPFVLGSRTHIQSIQNTHLFLSWTFPPTLNPTWPKTSFWCSLSGTSKTTTHLSGLKRRASAKCHVNKQNLRWVCPPPPPRSHFGQTCSPSLHFQPVCLPLATDKRM